EHQPEAARRFMVAYLHGVRDYLDAFETGRGQDEVIDILIKSTPIKDRALYATMRSVGLEPNGRVNVEYLRSEADLYVREGLLTARGEAGRGALSAPAGPAASSARRPLPLRHGQAVDAVVVDLPQRVAVLE